MRIVFAVLAMVSPTVKTVRFLSRTGTTSADVLLDLVPQLAFYGIGVLAGLGLRHIAKLVEARESFSICAIGLLVLGVCAFCDCGWVFSAPVAAFAFVRLLTMRSEFQ
ncbi:hypothetical protein L6R53_24210 [Myxococcota bacterium]|nr:hypothetical protein [Myxococcota bacterium]